jgi:trehalose-6-phosphatase
VHVVIITGRPLGGLARVFPFDAAWRIGRHGAESAAPGSPPGEATGAAWSSLGSALDEIRTPARALATRHEGAWVEDKLTSLALHTRACARSDAALAIECFRQLVLQVEGFEVLTLARFCLESPLEVVKLIRLIADARAR